ncbi:B12-binding domain-containing radical SAM protein [Clostridium luticellarii]|nr:B12-binding domain-containing radical SAM protein [Clostridium luticellarii]MCI1946093.1 DUF4070 domain-containing protein [Clostridium luticellarii]MCI1969207.1 DUF4070 domain-containing protein [Clostridium luticellarii]MCI1997009.1 DUF4070 domain-containing protein [Clostridium luticellarii]MCI2040347.1 DUF4070 domain-containing protein [Clostridium luticellarii]
MKILLAYPKSPETFWGFNHALKFISKKTVFPPLGLITVAAMLPAAWDKKLIDMNVEAIKDDDIKWADFVFISAMVIQKESARDLINRCKKFGVKTVAGGPLFTSEYQDFDDVDHLVLGEGELTIPEFLHDLDNNCLKHMYTTNEWADLSQTPAPLWNLIDMSNYATLNIQYSRGCPFNCEFCDITTLFGRIPRTKPVKHLISELDAIYEMGWKGSIFFVDDNFIGNRKKLKEEVLPALIEWLEQRDYPFSFLTEVSINLSDDDELMNLMVRAGFKTVFIGIETVSEESLTECNKVQNKNRNLEECVKKIQRNGLQVQGGFIIGFDSDNRTIFKKMIRFIQNTGIVTAMVGLLNAPRGTLLYKRLKKEGRIEEGFSGNNTSLSINFKPTMNLKELISGYKYVVSTIYSPKQYYERITNFLNEFRPSNFGKRHIGLSEIEAFLKANVYLGLFGKERKYYWKLFFGCIFKRPKVFDLAIAFAICGYHFRKISEKYT